MKNKKLNPMMLATFSAAFLLAACAGPENYQQKMARYTPKVIGKNQVPEIQTADFKFVSPVSVAKGRGPASVMPVSDKNEAEKDGNPTNKKLYFLSLYSQYETLKNYSAEFSGPNINICPNFHTSLIRHNEKVPSAIRGYQTRKFTYEANKLSDATYVAGHPELLLPLSKDEVTPKVVDIIRSSKGQMNEFAINELVHKALDIHLSKTYSEIRELCEYGVSDNYYVYENLITHIKNNKFEADNVNMNILLKTTLFSNVALMTSLETHKVAPTSGRAIASIPEDAKKAPYVGEVMARLNVTWANQYFEYIKESH